MNGFAIETDGLTRAFGDLRAVDDLTLQVPAGSIFGFLGPNGAGKTTTIRLLLGLLAPTSGSATVLGHDSRTASAAIRERSGALLEYSGLYERLSAADNLEFYGRVWHLPRAERAARIQELLAHFGLWERRREFVRTWSRGMKQKLALARTLLHRPALVFLDEPTAGLDPLAAAGLRADLAALAGREGVTVFLTTHNLAEAEKLCAQVGIIRAGRLVAVGPLEQLRQQSGTPHLDIIGRNLTEQIAAALRGMPGVVSAALRDGRLTVALERDASTAPLIQRVLAAGGEVEEARKAVASIEDVFLTLMHEEEPPQ